MTPKDVSFVAQLNNYDMGKVLIRSFFFQGSWNFKKMQNIGFIFSLLPALQKIYPNPQDFQQAVLRHLEFYNSHPYMASFVLGAVLNMEDIHAQGKGIKEEDIILFKKAMMGPMGALGDSFFWAALRPALGVICSVLVFLGLTLAPLIFFILYNIPHLYMKVGGLFEGYRLGRDVVEKIRRYNLLKYSSYLKSFMLIILGAMIPIVIKLDRFSSKGVTYSLPLYIGAGVVILVIAEIFQRKVSLNKLLLFISTICILLGLLQII